MTEPEPQLLAARGINELRKQTIDPSDKREVQLGVGLSSISEDKRLLARAWRFVASPGVLAITVGVVLLIWPDVTDLIGLVGAFALVAGLRALMIGAFTSPVGAGRQGWAVVEGAIGVAVGALVFVRPGLSARALLCAVAAWLIAAGFLELAAARPSKQSRLPPPTGVGARALMQRVVDRIKRPFFDLGALGVIAVVELDRLWRKAMNALAEPTNR
jgi:hypothetical protein